MNRENTFLNEAYIHYDYFKNIARRMTQNDFDAEDLTQETFIRAYRFIDQFEPGSNCKAWLFRIILIRKNRHTRIIVWIVWLMNRQM